MFNILEVNCLIAIVTLNLKIGSCTESPVTIKDVCKLSEERYPDEDHSVSDILRGYDLCLQILEKYPTTTRETLLKQLIDRLECFKEDLKESYYAGNVKYDDVDLVQSMESSLKNKDFNPSKLHTNYISCNLPRPVRSTVKHIIPLVVTGTLSEKQKACEAIFRQDKGKNISEKEIPTPTLDSNKDPKELTVPTASPCTYKVDSPEAQEALAQYYKVVMKCLTLTTEHKIQVFRFNRRFYDWLSQAVLPHLKDDKCYPAFGGVLRIVETMRQNDFVPKNATADFIFYRQKDLGSEEEERRRKEEYPSRIFQFAYFPLIFLPIIFFIWLIACFVCWRTNLCEFRFKCCECCANEENDSTDTEIFYYPIDDPIDRSISLLLDEDSSNAYTDASRNNPEERNKRQRGGADSQMYSAYGHESHMNILSIPLKRLWNSKTSTNYSGLPSPGKRPKKT